MEIPNVSPTEELNNDVEMSHYKGARGFYYALERINDPTRRAEIKEQHLKVIFEGYPGLQEGLIEDLESDEAKAEMSSLELAVKKKEIRDLSFERFTYIVNLAEKDHIADYKKNKNGVSSNRRTW